MTSPKYEVHVSTGKAKENGYCGFKAIEIIPPVPKALAHLVSERVLKYMTVDRGVPDNENISLTPHGFCDEGAVVNTLLKFDASPTFTDDLSRVAREVSRLANVVQHVISPSGAAIARD